MHGQSPDAGPRENSFGHNRAGEERSELQPQDGDDGNQRVAKRMPKQDNARREALSSGGAHVVTRKLFENGAANHASEDRGQCGSQRRGRQDVIERTTTARNRQESEFNRKEKDQHRS